MAGIEKQQLHLQALLNPVQIDEKKIQEVFASKEEYHNDIIVAVLGEVGKRDRKEYLPDVVLCLHSKDSVVRKKALEALGRMGSSLLIDLLQKEAFTIEENLLEECIEFLLEHTSYITPELVHTYLRRYIVSNPILKELMIQLASVAPTQSEMDGLYMLFLEEKNIHVKHRMALLLAKTSKSARDFLLEILGGEHRNKIRLENEEINHTIAILYEASADEGRESLEDMVLYNNSATIRLAALKKLSTDSNTSAFSVILKKLLKDKSDEVIEFALSCIETNYVSEEMLASVYGLMQNNKNGNLRSRAALTIERIQSAMTR